MQPIKPVTGHEHTHERLMIDTRRQLKYLIYSRTKARVSSESEKLYLAPAPNCHRYPERFLSSAGV